MFYFVETGQVEAFEFYGINQVIYSTCEAVCFILCFVISKALLKLINSALKKERNRARKVVRINLFIFCLIF